MLAYTANDYFYFVVPAIKRQISYWNHMFWRTIISFWLLQATGIDNILTKTATCRKDSEFIYFIAYVLNAFIPFLLGILSI